jgi:hypothetical protein
MFLLIFLFIQIAHAHICNIPQPPHGSFVLNSDCELRNQIIVNGYLKISGKNKFRKTTIQPAKETRHFQVDRNGKLTLYNVKLIKGVGGAIWSRGIINIQNSVFSQNLGNDGTAIIIDGLKSIIKSSEISNNYGNSAILIKNKNKVIIRETKFISNYENDIHIHYNPYIPKPLITIINTFFDNQRIKGDALWTTCMTEPCTDEPYIGSCASVNKLKPALGVICCPIGQKWVHDRCENDMLEIISHAEKLNCQYTCCPLCDRLKYKYYEMCT